MKARKLYALLACASFGPAFMGLYLSTTGPWVWLTAVGYGLAIASIVANYRAHEEGP